MRTLTSVGLIVASVSALSACREVEGQTALPIKPVRIQAVSAAPAASPLRFSATMRPESQVSVAFKASGYVAAIGQRAGVDNRMRALQAGDAIREGEVLARLRDDDYRERVNQAGGSAREVEAALIRARLDFERAQFLFASESLTKPDYDRAQAAVAAGEAQLIAAQAQQEMTRLSLQETTIASPISGVVLERRIEVGTLAAPGVIAFVIAETTPIRVVIGVPDVHLSSLTVGRSLRVTSDGTPGEVFEGLVSSVAPIADQQNRLFQIELSVANRNGHLRPGMVGSVDVPEYESALKTPGSAIAIPLAAVVASTDTAHGYSVFVVDANGDRGIARARSIDLGEVRGSVVTITRGLQPGDSVVISGPGLLTDGDQVRIVP